jgi:hypothetical protein
MSTIRSERLALGEFASWPAGPVVSVFLPQDPAHTDVDTIQLKAAHQWAVEELTRSFGLSSQAAHGVMAPLLETTTVAPDRRHGTAWFLSADRNASFPLRDSTEMVVSVGSTADVLTLLPYLDLGPEYYALAISQHRVRVFRADRFDIEPVPVPKLPKSLEDALWYIRREPTLERHGSGMAHQSGGGQNLHKDDIRQFLHYVDRAMTSFLNGSHAPLVVMGVGYEAAMYINESHYRYIVTTPVTGNPDTIDIATIHDRTFAVVDGLPGPAKAAAERARSFVGTGRAVTRLDEIVGAAAAGAVDQLLVSRAAVSSGERRSVIDADHSALNNAIFTSAAAGGKIHLVPACELPAEAIATALLRY